MGDMADMALDAVIEHEALLDEYVSGNVSLQDAYEEGIVDEMGVEQSGVQAAWDRSPIPTMEVLDTSLHIAGLEFDLAVAQQEPVARVSRLNSKAIENLSNAAPTCNICEKIMSSQKGRYGKFYYCKSKCKGQKTVSDSYWQDVRRNK
ncbi:hypothetical protein N9112_00415 [bacterium]|nr:hypothetical protein [bacterium]